MSLDEAGVSGAALEKELRNFQEIARQLIPEPGEVPRLAGIDVWGGTRSLGGAIGGDHLIWVDFKQRYDLDARIAAASDAGESAVVEGLVRCRRRSGIAVLDVSGHRMTDALLAAMTHQAFLLGALYELDLHGQITAQLFENLNTRLYNSSGAHKFVSLLYGEVSEAGTFRFVNSGQPQPQVFSSREDRFVEIDADRRAAFPPLGIQPSLSVIDRDVQDTILGFKDAYQVNEWRLLGAGDLLLLYTDGLAEHADHAYFQGRVEARLRELKHRTAREIHESLVEDALAACAPEDDITLVVVKRD